MFTRNLLLLIILSSCSIASIDTSNLDFDDSFSNSDKFQFNKCLRNTSEKIKLNNLWKKLEIKDSSDHPLKRNKKIY